MTLSPTLTNPGQSVTLTATVSPLTASGSVTFKDGSAVLGMTTLSGGTASFAVSALSLGSHSLTAVYAGDTFNAASTSSAVTHTVNKNTTVLTLTSSPNPSSSGQNATLTATVFSLAATGSVTFKDGSAVLGTSTVITGTATLAVPARYLSALIR